MFGLKKVNTEKMRVKILATLLILTLTFANFALLGSYLGKAIAVEIDLAKQGYETNNENVKFDVYLDENNRDIKETTAEIGSEAKFTVSVSVQKEGYLKNPRVQIINANFKFKNDPQAEEFGLNDLSTNQGSTVSIPIVVKNEDSFNLNMLDNQTEIKLTGEYTDSKGNVTDIDSTKSVKLNWTTNELTEENVELSQEVITNKIYSIDGANKRIIQLLVTSKLKDNIAPVKSSTIEVTNPQIEGEPTEVTVSAYTTNATNGKTSIEFGEEGFSTWEYNQEESKTYIKLLNNANDENKVSWAKNSEDKFVITYVYDESINMLPFISDVKNTIEVYGKAQAIEKTSEITLQELNEMGDIAKIENNITNNIYKGKMYLGEDTNYETTSKVYIPYSKLVNDIQLEDLDVDMPEGLSTYYKATKINRNEALKLLGEEGTITIYSALDKETPIKEINLSEETEDEYYTISYEENINKIAIKMSKAVAEGTISIINEKAVKVLDTEIVKELTELKSNTELTIADSNNTAVVNLNDEKTAQLLEPKTDFRVSLDKSSISTIGENSVKITAELIAKDESNKLFKNPTLNIELPAEITEASIENITPVIGGDVLTVNSSNVITNDSGLKVIVVEFKGEQTKYSANTPTIAIDAKIKTSSFMADKEVELKSTIINNGENVQKINKLQIDSKSGLVTKSTVKVGETVVEKINQSTVKVDAKQNQEIEINSSIINNYDDVMTDQTILGTIPAEAVLSSEVTTNIKDAVVYYSEEENASKESESWKTKADSLEKIKSFKIEGADLEKGEQVVVNYKYALNESANENTLNTAESTLKVTGTVDKIAKEETLKYIANAPATENETQSEIAGEQADADELSIQLVATVGGEEIKKDEPVNNGQVIRYKITVTNKSEETLNDVKLKATLKNGVFYGLIPSGFIEDSSKDETGNFIYPEGKPVYTYDETNWEYKELTIKTLNPNTSKTFEYQAVAYIGEGEDNNQFKNNVLITKEGMDDVSLTDTREIKEAKLALKLKYGYSENVKASSSSDVDFILEAKNLTDLEIQNAVLKIDLPAELDCDVENQVFINSKDGVTISKENNQIKVMFNTIPAKKTKSVKVNFIINLPLNELQKDITLKMTGNIGESNETYTSNDYTRAILQGKSHIKATLMSDKIGETLKKGDKITYTATITNDGLIDISYIDIEDNLPYEFSLLSLKLVDNDGKEEVVDAVDDNINVGASVQVGNTVKLIVEAEVVVKPMSVDSVSNKVIISGNEIDTVETEELINKLSSSNTDSEQHPEQNPGGGEQSPEPNPGGEEQNPGNNSGNNSGGENSKNSISGLAWLDSNKDGMRNENEELLQAVKVILLDSEQNKVAETATSLAGTYKFADIEQGEYTVAFEYDNSKYAVTKYQISNATEETNSDAISKEIEIDGKTINVGVTDTIKLQNADVTNIDIGLIENAKFDLRLDKYVNKVVLTNDAGTSTYEFENTNLAKVEISAKRIAGTVMMVEYNLKVTNEGDVDAYIGDVIDYLPDGFVFTSETNKDWYMDGNKVLHNKTLAEQVLKPGETKTVPLVLTKTLKADSTGTTENIGEIGESSNMQGIKEFDSVAGNKQTGEDDLSKAGLIVSISTGSPVMYIGIIIGTMIVLGLGIYVINKKVLKERI